MARSDRHARQLIVLHTHNAVIAISPVEGFPHATNTPDGLGRDAVQSPCAMAQR